MRNRHRLCRIAPSVLERHDQWTVDANLKIKINLAFSCSISSTGACMPMHASLGRRRLDAPRRSVAVE